MCAFSKQFPITKQMSGSRWLAVLMSAFVPDSSCRTVKYMAKYGTYGREGDVASCVFVFPFFLSFRKKTRYVRRSKQPRVLVRHGNGHGNPEKSTGPPSPASASNRLMMTAMAASSLVSELDSCCGDGVMMSPKTSSESPGPPAQTKKH